jgi:hypothetical protein
VKSVTASQSPNQLSWCSQEAHSTHLKISKPKNKCVLNDTLLEFALSPGTFVTVSSKQTHTFEALLAGVHLQGGVYNRVRALWG